MPTIGITGGIASGKTTFSHFLKRYFDADWFSADQYVRELLEGDAFVRAEISAAFGESSIIAEGHIDRAALREIIFESPSKRRDLEGILHPRVRQKWSAQLAAARQAGRSFAAEIPLLYEVEAASAFDWVVAVGCPKHLQLERLVRTRRIPEATAERMIASQLQLDEKLRRADFAAWSDVPEHFLHEQAKTLAGALSRG